VDKFRADPNCPMNFEYHYDSYLPQGAPTSPALANLVAYGLDRRLSGLATNLGVRYTRYADDLTFSGNYSQLPKLGLINTIVRSEGFYINPSKTSLRRRGQQQKVTGLIVSGTIVKVPKKYKKEVWKHLYFAKKFGVYKHLENIKNSKFAFQDWLLGRIMFIRSIELEEGNKMLHEFYQIKWPFYD
jgi:RNA-directed DNA polymerase